MIDFVYATSHYAAYVKETPGSRDPALLERAMEEAFLQLDEALKQDMDSNSPQDRSGCTALAAFITPTHIILGHAGDSRGIFGSGGKVRFRPIVDRLRIGRPSASLTYALTSRAHASCSSLAPGRRRNGGPQTIQQ